jgi:metacaspase-1
MSAVPRMATGRALCIGVEAESDALTFAEIARQKGFDSPSLLLGEGATRAAVRARIDALAAVSEPGDIVLITFSGHGGRIRLRDRAVSPDPVGLWQLYDGSLHDEQLKADLGRLRAGVRALVVSDNCSGGIPSVRTSQLTGSLSASVLVITSCRNDQYADGAGLPGHFAAVLERTWSGGAFAGAYSQFHAALCSAMPDYQKPDYYRVGPPNEAFESQRPFTI